MTAVMVGGSPERVDRLSKVLHEAVSWVPVEVDGVAAGRARTGLLRFEEEPARMSVSLGPGSVRLLVICVDSFSAPGNALGPGRTNHLRNAVLAALLPMQAVAAQMDSWCRVVWTISLAGYDGTADVVQAAVEYAAIGAMRSVTREFAATTSTVALVLNTDARRDESETLLVETIAMLADGGSSFYTGQVLRLSEYDGVELKGGAA